MKFLLISFIFFIFSCTQKKTETKIEGLKFSETEIRIENFSEIEKNKVKPDTINLKSGNGEILKITPRKLSLDEAKKNIDYKRNEIKMLFAPQNVPYFGQITKEIKCTESVNVSREPVENDSEYFVYSDLNATEYFIYGSCIEDQEIYKSQLLFLYCKKNETLYEIKYFHPKKENFKNKIANCTTTL